MKIKNVVKVMNFQALLRMDKALKEADKYHDVGKEVTDILSRIMYNKNLILDKMIFTPDKSKPKLNIFSLFTLFENTCYLFFFIQHYIKINFFAFFVFTNSFSSFSALFTVK